MRKKSLLQWIVISILGVACLIPVGVFAIMAAAILASLIPNTQFPSQYFREFICDPVPKSVADIRSYKTSGFGSFGWWVSFSIDPNDFETLVSSYKKDSDFSDLLDVGDDPFRVKDQLYSAAKEIKLPPGRLALFYQKHFTKEKEVYDVAIYATTDRRHIIARISDE